MAGCLSMRLKVSSEDSVLFKLRICSVVEAAAMNKLSKVEDLNYLKIKTSVLKVNIHCEGCRKKVKKLLQKIDGVYAVAIDAEQGKVTVTGNVDSSTLVKKLRKSGKHAELWTSKKSSNSESHHRLPMLPTDTTKGKKNSLSNSGTKDQKMQLLQKELNNMKLPSTKDVKSVKFSVPNQDFDDGSEFDDSFDDEDDYFDETDASDDEIYDYNSDVKAMNPATKGIMTAKKGFGGEVHNKGNNGSKNGVGGAHEAKSGSNKGSNNGDGNNNGHKQGNGGMNSSGLAGIPPAAGAVSAEYFNRGMAATSAAPAARGSLNPYQQQYMNEMMQQQRMMMNGYPMAYEYPLPASNSYASYFSDENTSGGCRIM